MKFKVSYTYGGTQNKTVNCRVRANSIIEATNKIKQQLGNIKILKVMQLRSPINND